MTVNLLQVANVLRAQSAEGLSALAFELESWGLLVHATYGYLKGLPFSAYGEAVMMLAQNVLLLALIYKFARMPVSRALAAAVVAVSAVAGVFTGEAAGNAT
jgi:mannose-P-dolichol utilization defect protein 1